MAIPDASGTVISYPVPLYANLPIEFDDYQPTRFVISGLSLGVTTTVTMTENHNYVIGQLVRFIIPPTFGTRQLNNKEGYVISIPADNQVNVNIYSVGMDPFVSSSATTKAQILAIGDINLGSINSAGARLTSTHIPGSFINISP